MSQTPIDAAQLRELEQRLLADDALLPSLPEVALRVQAVVEDESSGVHEVAQVIQADAALSGKMIQVANAAQYAHMSKVSTVQAAIGRLGLKSVRNLALSFSMRSAVLLDRGPYRKRLQQAWRQSVTVAAISYVLASVTIGLESDRGLLAGLLHNIGEPALIRIADASGLPSEHLDDLLAQYAKAVGVRVLRHWDLDEFMPLIERGDDWQASGGTGKPDYLDLLVIARYHARMGQAEGEKLPPLTELPAFQSFPMLRLGPDMSVEVLRESHGKIKEIEALLA